MLPYVLSEPIHQVPQPFFPPHEKKLPPRFTHKPVSGEEVGFIDPDSPQHISILNLTRPGNRLLLNGAALLLPAPLLCG